MIEGKDFGRLESLDEFVKAIDMGLDIEFNLCGKRYNISTDETPFIAVCPEGEGVYYKNGADMAKCHYIDRKPLKDRWQEIEILAM